ncbi:MAG TPA: RNA polymerase-binding protein DksA [Arcobacter sp.]|jgi:DnaK suppressor protein|nr:RNA polymerase-binding protein DksA [Arcobacter sp.]
MASPKQIEELKTILEDRKVLIESNIEDSKNNIEQLKENECKDEYDFAESSSDTFTAEVIAKQQWRELKEIENALVSITEGNYGICEMCDDPIAIGRLRAKPFAKFCTACREIYEEENKK